MPRSFRRGRGFHRGDGCRSAWWNRAQPRLGRSDGLRDLLRLNKARQTNVYADIGYMSEFLIGPRAQGVELCATFFGRLGDYLRGCDEDCNI